MAEETVEFEGAKVITESPKAIQVRLASGKRFWIPKSCVVDSSEIWSEKNPGPGKLVVQEWIAVEKGME